MKKLIFLIATVFAFSASASDVQDARRAFNRMSATEAFSSDMFDKTVFNINIPTTSTWVKGTSLCVENGMIRTIAYPSYTQVCVKWSWRNSEGERRTTTDAATARRVDADCMTHGNGALLAHPINYTSEVTIWGARSEGQMITEIGGQTRVYRNYHEANEAGTPVDLGTQVVNRRVSTTYTVNFEYKDRNIGSHRYSVGQCN